MSKNLAGEGTHYRRKCDGRAIAALTLEDGKRKYFYADLDDNTEANAWKQLTDYRDNLARLRSVDRKRTVAQYLAYWLAESIQPHLRASTYRTYEWAVSNHLVPMLGKKKLTELKAEHVQTALNKMAAEGASPEQVAYVRKVLSIALKRAVIWEMATKNVAPLVQVAAVPKKKRTGLTSDQLQTFLTAIKGHDLEALYLLDVVTGLRSGEIRALTWSDVDMERGLVSVTKQIGTAKDRDGRYYLKTGPLKTDSSARVLEIPPAVVDALKVHRTRQKAARLAAGRDWKDRGLIFTNEVGQALRPQSILERLYAIEDGAGLPRKRFHDLRHTYATLSRQEGVPLEVVSDLLGHSNIGITANIYTDTTPAMVSDAAGKWGRLIAR